MQSVSESSVSGEPSDEVKKGLEKAAIIEAEVYKIAKPNVYGKHEKFYVWCK